MPSAPRKLTISPKSLERQAADAIRESILSGFYPVASRITELRLVADLGLSRGTIRGALQQLTYEGLVSLSPYKGWSVIALSAKDAWEIYTLRNALEGLASRLLAETMTPKKAEQIDAAFAQLSAAVRGGRRDQIIKADFGLHRTIMQLAEHGRLQAQYQIIEKQTRMFFAMAGAFLQVQDYVDLHIPLVDAIKSGNAAAAERIASEHNTIDGAALVKRLAGMERATRDGTGAKAKSVGAAFREPD
jgi:DNA-binding GntR family transcriptional regulator